MLVNHLLRKMNFLNHADWMSSDLTWLPTTHAHAYVGRGLLNRAT